jgi:hypothetical protein
MKLEYLNCKKYLIFILIFLKKKKTQIINLSFKKPILNFNFFLNIKKIK